MEMLQREVSDAFEAFFTSTVVPVLDAVEVDLVAIDPNAESIRGPRSFEWGYSWVDVDERIAHVRVRADLDQAIFEHTLAHEYTHVVQRLQHYPEVRRCPAVTANNEVAEDRVARQLNTLACVSIDAELRARGFDPSYASERRRSDLLAWTAQAGANADDPTNPLFSIAVLRYVRTALECGLDTLSELREALEPSLPGVTRSGDSLLRQVKLSQLRSREGRIRVMVTARDYLRLQRMVCIFDPEHRRFL